MHVTIGRQALRPPTASMTSAGGVVGLDGKAEHLAVPAAPSDTFSFFFQPNNIP